MVAAELLASAGLCELIETHERFEQRGWFKEALALPYSKEDLVVCFLRCSNRIDTPGCGKELDSAERTTIFTTEKMVPKREVRIPDPFLFGQKSLLLLVLGRAPNW